MGSITETPILNSVGDVLQLKEDLSRAEEILPQWKLLARQKRASQLENIPVEWRISQPSPLPVDTLSYLASHPLLTDTEQEITSRYSAAELLSLIATRKLSSLEVTTAFCKRAAVAQQLINCCTEIFFEEALGDARRLDEHLEREGKVVGPLHGLPVSLKDLFEVKGKDTSIGWVSLVNKPAESDCSLASALRSQGVVLYTKTNVSQSLMMSDSYNHIFKQSYNSLNNNLISGGSSGGEGAIVGCHASIVGVGTDIGGSVRIPANLQGLYGLCPTAGRVAWTDSVLVSNMLLSHPRSAFIMDAKFAIGEDANFKSTHVRKREFIVNPVAGPIARSLDTIEAFMKGLLIARPWETDVSSYPIPWRDELAQKPARKLKLGYYVDDGVVKVQPPIRRAVEEVVAKLRDDGHEVFEWDISSHAAAYDMWLKAILADGGRLADRMCAESGEPLVEGMLVGSQKNLLSVEEGEQLSNARIAYTEEYLRRWKDSGIDALIMPVQPWVGFRPKTWVKSSQYVGYTAHWNFVDFAAMSVPATTVQPGENGDDGWRDHGNAPRNESDRFNWAQYDPKLVEGMPVCVQVVGGRFGEENAIAVARVIEELSK